MNPPVYRHGEALLSYFCGLAPIGQPFQTSRDHLNEDLGRRHWAYYRQLIGSLIKIGAVRRVTPGYSPGTGVLVVLKRPEQVWLNPQRKRVTWRDPAAKEAA